MAIGKVQAGGWELMIIGVYILVVSDRRPIIDAVLST
jgi:hypothetical protein